MAAGIDQSANSAFPAASRNIDFPGRLEIKFEKLNEESQVCFEERWMFY